MFTIIACVGSNNELGKNGDLIWHIREDMQFFKQTTLHHKVLMGRKTLESLPNGKLPNRENYVASQNKNCNFDNDIVVIHDVEKFLEDNYYLNEEIFIIGGAKIYELGMKYAEKMVITHIFDSCDEADTFYPKIDCSIWNKKILGEYETNNLKYNRIEYTRKK